jgi:enoyl-CoA hydratase
MSDAPVLLTRDGGVGTLTINRPASLNALNGATVQAIGDVLASVAADRALRCLIVTGAGEKAFVAGADISEMVDMDEARGRAFAFAGQAAFAALEALPIPTIAAVNGFALGGGCELALACDFIYASTKAKFGQPEIKLGVIPGFGGTQRLLRRVGNAMAREMTYTGKMIDAQEALRIGLVNAVFEPAELLAKAVETASVLANLAPVAMAEAKRVLLDGADMSLATAIAREADAFGRCFTSSDQTEGMRAFLEKRAAKFTGA